MNIRRILALITSLSLLLTACPDETKPNPTPGAIITGIEASANYTRGPFDLYANVARGREKGKNINSSQYFFAPDELAYIQDHYIFTDHSQNWTASGGGSVTIANGAGTLIPTVNFLYGSGLRSGLIHVGNNHPAAFTRKGKGDFLADTAGGAGDDADFVLKFHSGAFKWSG